MTPFRIKVCGMTRARDARLAARFGADMVGVIFYRKSPRFVTMSVAREIVSALPATVAPVGVFVDTPVDRILSLAVKLRLAFVQLHGNYTVAQERRVRKEGVRTIRVVSIEKGHPAGPIRPDRSDLILLDSRIGDKPGGTGKRFDWSLKLSTKIPNLMLAGGIDADNVAEGVARFNPLVVDVNSGVESTPGIKSERKLRHFFEVCNKLRYGH